MHDIYEFLDKRENSNNGTAVCLKSYAAGIFNVEHGTISDFADRLIDTVLAAESSRNHSHDRSNGQIGALIIMTINSLFISCLGPVFIIVFFYARILRFVERNEQRTRRFSSNRFLMFLRSIFTVMHLNFKTRENTAHAQYYALYNRVYSVWLAVLADQTLSSGG